MIVGAEQKCSGPELYILRPVSLKFLKLLDNNKVSL